MGVSSAALGEGTAKGGTRGDSPLNDTLALGEGSLTRGEGNGLIFATGTFKFGTCGGTRGECFAITEEALGV